MASGTGALRRAIAGLVVASAFGIVLVSGAAAKTVTVGQLFLPTLTCTSPTSGATFLVAGVASERSYAVPKAGVITSWSFHDGGTSVTGLKLKVGRSAGSGKYTIVGDATAGRQTTDTVKTYKTRIAVKAGDLIGIYEDGGNCGSQTNNVLDSLREVFSDVPPHTTEPFPVTATGARLPVSVAVSEDCLVPNLKGKTLKAAKKALKQASCTLGMVRPKGQTTGKVKRQQPAVGKTRAPEAKVDVWLR